MQIQTSWLLRSQLIWIYTVCKDGVYPGSAGQGLRNGRNENISPQPLPARITGLPNCKLISVGNPSDVRYTTSSPHPNTPSLFLCFGGPVNTILVISSCSVYLTTLPGQAYIYAVNQYSARSYARNWQRPFLNKLKGENDRRKNFMTHTLQIFFFLAYL